MKKLIYGLSLLTFLLWSCSSSRNMIATTQEDKALLSAIKKLDKKPTDDDLRDTIAALYENAAKVHLENIKVYNTLTEADKWDKIIREFRSLQHLSDVINTSNAARSILHPPAYEAKIEVASQNAAKDYYEKGEAHMQSDDKESFYDAYTAFKKSQEFVPDYRDAKKQMDIAYQKSVLNVVINPVTDNSIYYNSAGWNRFGNSFDNDYLQRNLARDLGGTYTKNAPAHFYTDREAQRANVEPDLFVDLTWINLDIPIPYTSSYSRNVSKQIEKGRDTSGHVLYETVSATLYITKKYFTATGDLESRITDAVTGNPVHNNRYNARFDWQQEYATYQGDSRALSGYDLSILNNNNYMVPRKEDVLTELYQRIYPQVKNGIYNAVRR
ncbi:MAG: hypothetical protein ABIO82_07210 [Ginsengibacter sp.]